MNFISSFDRGSPRLIELLKAKAEQRNLASKDFATAYCRAMLFIARAQGPDLLKDKSLRLRTHLLAQKQELVKFLQTLRNHLLNIQRMNLVLGKSPASL